MINFSCQHDKFKTKENNMAWKTTTAGVAGILGSLGAIASGIASNPIDWTMIWGGVTGVIASLATLGIGGKLQKLIDAIKGK
jgi:hypothetical protein